MRKPTKFFALFGVFLTGILTCCARAEDCPFGDLHPDCRIDLQDVLVLASNWLEPEGSRYDLDKESGVNSFDFALVADQWLVRGPLVTINEFMAINTRSVLSPAGRYEDWIELHNPGDETVNVAGMYLTDDLAEPTKWRIPTDKPGLTTIEPNTHIVIWCDDDPVVSGLRAPFELDGNGEQIGLYDSSRGTYIDSIDFGDQEPDLSFGRYPQGSGAWQFMYIPTAGAPNRGGYIDEVEPVRFSHERGFYDQQFLLKLSTDTEGAKIYYTFDGSQPHDPSYRIPKGELYTGPINIYRTMVVRARAVKPGWKMSQTRTKTYLFGADDGMKSLPIISLVGDEKKTFYEPSGIMAVGSGYNNFIMRGKAYERPVSFEWIDRGETTDFQVDCGIRVHGSNWMRPRYERCSGYWTGNCKIAFRLYFRGEYGPSRLDYPLFPSEVDSFRSIVLRSGHNDRVNPFQKDELMRRLYADMGQVSSHGTYANLLINGQYKGYYNPCEHIKSEFCQDWWDTDNEFDVMTMNGIRDGSWEAWSQMMNFGKSQNLNNPDNYEQFAAMLDIPAFADYLILQLWNGNWDWPQNNWSAAREQSPDGKWRFFIWDAEGACFSDRLYQVRFSNLNSSGDENSQIYRMLKNVPAFRRTFGDRFFKHFYNGGALTPANINARFYEMKQQLRGVIPNMHTYVVDTWVPQRFGIFKNACINEGMFTFEGPQLCINGTAAHGGYISPDAAISLYNTRGSGTVWYTLDGSDPADTAGLPAGGFQYLVTGASPKRAYIPTGPISDNWRGGEYYNDSYWRSSSGEPGGVGYERGRGYESLISLDMNDQMYDRNTCCYVRVPFTFSGTSSSYDKMMLQIKYDDAFVAYLNGHEIARKNVSGEPEWNSSVRRDHPDSQAVVFEEIDVSQHLNKLTSGQNVLAIHGINTYPADSDFLILAQMYVDSEGSAGGQTGAIEYQTPFNISRTTQVKARIQTGNTWSALTEATFAVGSLAANLRITKIMYHPEETGDPNDGDREFIELKNIGASAVNLNMVEFTDGIGYKFGPQELGPDEYIVLVKDVNAFRAEYGDNIRIAGPYKRSLSNGGERITLVDGVGSEILDFEYKDGWFDITDGNGFSLSLRDYDATNPQSYKDKDSWRPSAFAGGSPGWDDAGQLPEPGSIVINEVLAHAHAQAPDWIELHNTTDRPINIGGWYLSDSESNPMKYRISDDLLISGGDHMVFYEDTTFNNPGGDPGCLVPFALSENGEEVLLSSAQEDMLTGYRDYEDFGASPSGVSFGRYYKASTDSYNFVLMSSNTPWQANAYPRVGPIVINEIMYNPAGGDQDQEYIELYNISSSPVTLYDYSTNVPWKMTDGVEHVFGTNPTVTVQPDGYLLLVRSISGFTQSYGEVPRGVQIFEYDSGGLNNGGEKVEISMPGDVDTEGKRYYIRIDRVNYSDGSHPEGSDPWPAGPDGNGPSLSRINPAAYGNDVANWNSAAPSPGRTNY